MSGAVKPQPALPAASASASVPMATTASTSSTAPARGLIALSEPCPVIADAQPQLAAERLVVACRLVLAVGHVQGFRFHAPCARDTVERLQVEQLVTRQRDATVGPSAHVEQRGRERPGSLR